MTAAQTALVEGAYRARRAARLIPGSAPEPNVKAAMDGSEAMFNACKDVSP
jgi:hypothetical protein